MRGVATTHILTALRMEFLALSVLTEQRSDVKVHLIGMGGRRMPRVKADSRVVVAGLAGALDPTLRVGDLVIDTPLEGLPRWMRWRVGPIHTATHLVSTPQEKAALHEATGALAVDMEHSVVRAAVPAGVQVIGIRAISDRANRAVDPVVLGMIDDCGQPRPLAVAWNLLKRPGLIPQLRELQANSRKAITQLSLGVCALLERFPPAPHSAYAPPDPS